MERTGDNTDGVEKMRTVVEVRGENRDGDYKMRVINPMKDEFLYWSDSVFCEKFRHYVGADEFFHLERQGERATRLLEVTPSHRPPNRDA